MNFEFSKHAKDKMELFDIKEEDILKSLMKPRYVCKDNEKQSTVCLVDLRGRLFSIVVKESIVITIYRTDEKKLHSRIRSGRWNCY